MERLTKRMNGVVTYTYPSCPYDNGIIAAEMEASDVRTVLARLAAYEDTELGPEEIISGKELAGIACALYLLKRYQALGTIEELGELIKAKKEGRLVVLPCKVGDKVYTIHSDEDGSFVEELSTSEVSSKRFWAAGKTFSYSDIGKTVFLTKAAAEEEFYPF